MFSVSYQSDRATSETLHFIAHPLAILCGPRLACITFAEAQKWRWTQTIPVYMLDVTLHIWNFVGPASQFTNKQATLTTTINFYQNLAFPFSVCQVWCDKLCILGNDLVMSASYKPILVFRSYADVSPTHLWLTIKNINMCHRQQHASYQKRCPHKLITASLAVSRHMLHSKVLSWLPLSAAAELLDPGLAFSTPGVGGAALAICHTA